MPKFAVVTGASSGIGAEFARQLSARGYNLMLVARRADRLQALSNSLTTECEIFTADLARKSECLRLADALADRRIDLFINNAGFGDCGPFLQTDLEKELQMIETNVRALHILTKRIVQQMEEQGSGALLNVGSCAGLMPAGPYMAAYYATKAYVVSLTSAVAEELREMHSPVYVGCLCPGPVNTEFNAVANVQFALKGITPEFCVRCALHGIHRRKTIIVPGPLVAAGMTLGRYQDRGPSAAEKVVSVTKRLPLRGAFLLHPKATQKTFLFLLFFLQGLCYNQYCIAICKQRRARLCQRRRNRAARAPKLNIPGRGIGHAPLRRLSSLPARPRPTASGGKLLAAAGKCAVAAAVPPFWARQRVSWRCPASSR